MRRIVLWAMGTVVVLVLLFSYRTSTSPTMEATAQVGPVQGSVSAGSATQTYAGAPVASRYGDVQVQITVLGGSVTSATTLQVPNRNPRDVEANARAVPILNREVLDAQSAEIDMVSGATVTSSAYIESLQSALDQAHL